MVVDGGIKAEIDDGRLDLDEKEELKESSENDCDRKFDSLSSFDLENSLKEHEHGKKFMFPAMFFVVFFFFFCEVKILSL